MSNKSEIQIIAEAVLANARVLEALIAKLPDATKVAVAAEVSKTTPAPAAVQAPAPDPVIQTPAPVIRTLATAPEPVIPEPAPVTVTTSSAMPAVPFPTEPAAPAPTPPAVPTPSAPAVPAAASPSKAPFTDQRGLITYAMNKYKEIGSEKGKQIQVILNGLGINNINEAKPAQYDAIYAGIEGIK